MTLKDKANTAHSVIQTINTGINIYKDARERWTNKRLYTASIPEDAFVFRPLLLWIDSQVHTRSITFVSTSRTLQRLYDAQGSTRVNIHGHELSVALRKPAIDNINLTSLDTNSNPFMKSLVFQTTDPRGIDALHNFLKEIMEQETLKDKEVWVYRPGGYGWNAGEFYYRDIDAIFLPDGEKETLMADLENFFDKEERYHTIGIPYHRGYALYGPPGNGKTSLIAGLAHYYKRNLYTLPLSVVKDDKSLNDLISGVEEDSFLLFEDIDIFSKSVTRDKENNNGPTLAGLLNGLDGVTTPNGLVTFITTNVIKNIDKALLRPGRVDYKLKLVGPVDSQITNMFERVFGEPLGGKPREFESMAALADVFKRYPDSPEAARAEVLTDPA